MAATLFPHIQLHAQADLGLGHLRFVNATGSEGKVFFKLDGEEINPEGYASGLATGPIGFPMKSYAIEMRHDTLGETKAFVQLQPGELKSVIVLPKVEEPKDGKPPEVTLTHFVLESVPSSKGRDPTLTLLQMTPLPTLDLNVGGIPCSLGRLKPDTVTISKSMGDFPTINFGNNRVCTLNYHDPEDAVLVLFTDGKGALRHVTFKNTVK